MAKVVTHMRCRGGLYNIDKHCTSELLLIQNFEDFICPHVFVYHLIRLARTDVKFLCYLLWKAYEADA